MNYSYMRLIMTLVLTIILLLLLRWKHIQFAARRFFFVIMAAYCILFYIPFDAHVTFPSAEAVWYYKTGGEKIFKVIEGQNSSMVIKKDGSRSTYDIYPRSETGWRLNTALPKMQSVIIDKSFTGTATFFRAPNSNECFVIIDQYIIDEVFISPLKIYDNAESRFKIIDADPYIIAYCAVIQLPEEQYELTVENETTVLDLRKLL